MNDNRPASRRKNAQPNHAKRRLHLELLEDRCMLSAGGASGGEPANLIHHWELDETNGLVAADSVGGASGALVNMSGSEWTGGFHDGALAFDGANDYVSVGSVPSLQLAQDMTIAAWVNTDEFPNWGGIAGWVHDSGATESGYSLNTMSGDGFAFGLKTENGGINYLTANGFETDRWYHIAGVYDGATQRLYVDGVEVAAVARTGAIDWDPLGTDGFEIGRYHDDNEDLPLAATIDDVRVYDRALSAAEVRQITDVNPVGQWDFDDENDLTAATIGTDLTLVGSHTAVDGILSGDGAAEIGVGSHYIMDHGIAPNGGGSFVNEWSLAIDVLAPEVNRWIALYQTNTSNSNDGDAFVRNSGNTIGVAQTGYSSEGILANQWYRIVFSVDNGDHYDIYLNGEKILDGAVQSIDERFALESALLMFADENAEDNTIDVSKIAIYDRALSDDEARFLGSIASTELVMLTNPYLQNAKTDGITIMWEMSDTVAMTVDYGLDDAYGATVVATATPSGFIGSYIYKAEITGLTDATEYHFRVVGVDDEPVTEDRTFTTFTEEEIDFNFAMWGDSQGTNHGVWTADPYAPTPSLFDHMVAQGVDFGFSVGDLAENGGSYSDTRVYYLDRVAEHLGQSTPWFNAWGNHDGGSGSAIRQFADMPSEDRGGSYNSGYGSFAFEQGGVLFIAIDYFSDNDITNGFLEGVLQAHPDARFTVLGIHVPVYGERWIDGNAGYRATLQPLAEQYGIDVITSGHTHEYNRGTLNGVNYIITGQASWLDHPEVVVHDWDHMVVGGAQDIPANWSIESSPGVLGPPQPIVGGLVNGYTEFIVTGHTMEVRMHGFNADGSYIGVLDNFLISNTISGDFDGDDDVDGDDFLSWQTGFGITAGATFSDGDADADGDVDGDDFLVWQSQFGASGGGGAAVIVSGAPRGPNRGGDVRFSITTLQVETLKEDPLRHDQVDRREIRTAKAFETLRVRDTRVERAARTAFDARDRFAGDSNDRTLERDSIREGRDAPFTMIGRRLG